MAEGKGSPDISELNQSNAATNKSSRPKKQQYPDFVAEPSKIRIVDDSTEEDIQRRIRQQQTKAAANITQERAQKDEAEKNLQEIPKKTDVVISPAEVEKNLQEIREKIDEVTSNYVIALRAKALTALIHNTTEKTGPLGSGSERKTNWSFTKVMEANTDSKQPTLKLPLSVHSNFELIFNERSGQVESLKRLEGLVHAEGTKQIEMNFDNNSITSIKLKWASGRVGFVSRLLGGTALGESTPIWKSFSNDTLDQTDSLEINLKETPSLKIIRNTKRSFPFQDLEESQYDINFIPHTNSFYGQTGEHPSDRKNSADTIDHEHRLTNQEFITILDGALGVISTSQVEL